MLRRIDGRQAVSTRVVLVIARPWSRPRWMSMRPIETAGAWRAEEKLRTPIDD